MGYSLYFPWNFQEIAWCVYILKKIWVLIFYHTGDCTSVVISAQNNLPMNPSWRQVIPYHQTTKILILQATNPLIDWFFMRVSTRATSSSLTQDSNIQSNSLRKYWQNCHCSTVGVQCLTLTGGAIDLLFSSMNVRYSQALAARWGNQANPHPPMVTVQQEFEGKQQAEDDRQYLEFLQQHCFARMASSAKCLIVWKNILVRHNLDQPCGRPLSL